MTHPFHQIGSLRTAGTLSSASDRSKPKKQCVRASYNRLFTHAQVREIRLDLKRMSRRQVADKYRVSLHVIANLDSGVTYASVKD